MRMNGPQATPRVATPWKSTLLSAVLIFASAPFTLGAAPLHLDFSHEIDQKRLFRDSLRYTNSRDEQYSITRLAWLATGFSLTTETGKIISLPPTLGAFVPSTGATVTLPDLPTGKYKSLSFHLGPDSATNHADPARFSANHPLNPNLNNLHWDWAGGYIFLAMEGHWRPKEPQPTQTHRPPHRPHPLSHHSSPARPPPRPSHRQPTPRRTGEPR